MPKTKAPDIPEAVQRQVNEIVQKFNQRVIKDPDLYYVPRFKGKYRIISINRGKLRSCPMTHPIQVAWPAQ